MGWTGRTLLPVRNETHSDIIVRQVLSARERYAVRLLLIMDSFPYPG